MARARSRIASLAAEIVEGTSQIDSFLASNGLPQPSFDVDGPMDLRLSPEMTKINTDTIAATEELGELLRGPRELHVNAWRGSQLMLDVIIRFDLASKLPIHGEMSYTDLAAECGISESALKTVIRHAIAWHVFAEKRPGFVSHSLASRLLAEDSAFREYIMMIREEIFLPGFSLAEALSKWPAADEPGQSAYLLAHRSDAPSMFAHMARDPKRLQRFATAMRVLGKRGRLAEDFPWAALSPGSVVVDVGGSDGAVAIKLANAFPHLKFIVQDLADTLKTAKHDSTASNVSFMEHDFFLPQPVKDADVYFIRRCLHDWPDRYCIKILRALTGALKPGAKVLIVDGILPPFGTVSTNVERSLRHFDVGMLLFGNAKERDLEDWHAVVAAADSRFNVAEVRLNSAQDIGSVSIIELVWQP